MHLAEREGTPRVVPDAIDVANPALANDWNGNEDGEERAPGSAPASSGSDGDEDADDAEVERLRLALRRQKAELEARLREREASLAREAATSGGRGRSRVDHWRGVWLSFGDACPLFDASRARFARCVPDAEGENRVGRSASCARVGATSACRRGKLGKKRSAKNLGVNASARGSKRRRSPPVGVPESASAARTRRSRRRIYERRRSDRSNRDPHPSR